MMCLNLIISISNSGWSLFYLIPILETFCEEATVKELKVIQLHQFKQCLNN